MGNCDRIIGGTIDSHSYPENGVIRNERQRQQGQGTKNCAQEHSPQPVPQIHDMKAMPHYMPVPAGAFAFKCLVAPPNALVDNSPIRQANYRIRGERPWRGILRNSPGA